MLDGVRVDANDAGIIIQLGDAGGYETAGYVGMAMIAVGTSTGVDNLYGAGIQIERAVNNSEAADTRTAIVRLSRWVEDENKWFATGTSTQSDNIVAFIHSVKTMSEALTSIRLNTATGTADFDAGSAVVRYRELKGRI